MLMSGALSDRLLSPCVSHTGYGHDVRGAWGHPRCQPVIDQRWIPLPPLPHGSLPLCHPIFQKKAGGFKADAEREGMQMSEDALVMPLPWPSVLVVLCLFWGWGGVTQTLQWGRGERPAMSPAAPSGRLTPGGPWGGRERGGEKEEREQRCFWRERKELEWWGRKWGRKGSG